MLKLKELLLTSIAVFSITIVSVQSYAAPTGKFKTGLMTVTQAKGSKLTNTAFNQLFICNNTNLPAQPGMAIRISFPQAGVTDQIPQPGSCAYLSNDNGRFSTQGIIDAPANNPYPIFNHNFTSGQMWGVTYDMTNNSYAVAQIQ